MNEETQKALRIFYKLQNELQKTDDTIRLKQVNQIIAVLESSFYSKIVEINRSLSDLKRYKNIQADDIEIDVETGRFSVNKALSVESGRKRKSTAPGMTPRQPMSHEDFEKRIKLLCGTRELKHVQINKLSVAQPLGFSINCSNQNRGIFIEDVTPGGVADNCGIRVSDQIIAVDGVPLDDPDTNRTVALNALKSGQARIDLHLAKASVAITVSSSSQLSPSTIKDQGHLRNRSDIGLIRELTTEWTQYEIIELDSRQGSFGFGIAGGLSDGALVRTILSGGAADLEGRLQINDHLMYINEHSVRRLNTNQVADILKANSQHVTLIVARPYDQRSQLPGNGGRMQMVETENLDARLEMIVNQLRQEKLGGAARKSSEKNRFEANIQGERGSLASEMYRDESEDIIEHIVIELPRSNTSLGMSIARVCLEDSEHLGTLDGVFVRSVVPNGIADQAGVTKFDRVMKINGTLIDNRDMERSVQKLLSNHNKLDLEVQRYVSGPTLLLLLSNELHATDISVNDQLDNSDASSVDSCDGQQVQRQQPLYREFEINQYRK